MERASSNSSGMAKGLIIGLLTGSAIGAGVALLYAPKTGRRMRAELREKADNLIDEGQDYLSTVQDKATEIIEDAKDSITSMFKRAEREVGGRTKESARASAKER